MHSAECAVSWCLLVSPCVTTQYCIKIASFLWTKPHSEIPTSYPSLLVLSFIMFETLFKDIQGHVAVVHKKSLNPENGEK